MANIIINVPHASNYGIFDPELGGWFPHYDFYNEYVSPKTDWLTDFLFAEKGEDIQSFVFPYSRFVCDVEKMEHNPSLTEGQGIIYTQYGSFKRTISDESIAFLLKERENYLARLSDCLDENSVLLDCHSFSDRSGEVDAYIGCDFSFDLDDGINPNGQLVSLIAEEFRNSGYKMSYNTHSNSLTSLCKEMNYCSAVIKVNKRIYMNEDLCRPNVEPRQWMRWFGMRKRIYQRIRNEIKA